MLNKKPYALVVDDDKPSGKIEKSLLMELGYACSVAESGMEALLLIARNEFSLVMMDIQMPGIDGMETARRIREYEKAQSRPPVPIIGLTGRATNDDRLLCLRAGMDGYLSKPFFLKDLESRIWELCVPAN